MPRTMFGTGASNVGRIKMAAQQSAIPFLLLATAFTVKTMGQILIIRLSAPTLPLIPAGQAATGTSIATVAARWLIPARLTAATPTAAGHITATASTVGSIPVLAAVRGRIPMAAIVCIPNMHRSVPASI